MQGVFSVLTKDANLDERQSDRRIERSIASMVRRIVATFQNRDSSSSGSRISVAGPGECEALHKQE
jgi:hypothetical protein